MKAFAYFYGYHTNMWEQCRSALHGLRLGKDLELCCIVLEADSEVLVKILQGSYATPWELCGPIDQQTGEYQGKREACL